MMHAPFLPRRLLPVLALLAPLCGQAQDAPQPPLPAAQLSAGIHAIRAEVAQTEAQRQAGLMFRREMGVNDGMLFVFPDATAHCFWMRNTPLPLSIAFLGDDGRIVNIADMQPQTTVSHCAAQPVRYALEMHQGWFAKRGLKAGARLAGAPFKRP